MMREPGLEPGSQPWQGRVIATILLPLISAEKRCVKKGFESHDFYTRVFPYSLWV